MEEIEQEDEVSTGQRSRYEGEDTSPTTTKELRGWYSYSMGSEIFAVCGPGSFLPVTIEQLARENGVLFSDRSTPCVRKDDQSSALRTRASASDNGQCIISFFGMEMTSASLVMYTFSAAVFIQALTLVSVGSVADAGNNRKRLLLSFALAGSIATMCFVFVFPAIYPFATLLSILAITCNGCAGVMMNSFLPLLASNHPLVREAGEPRSTKNTQTLVSQLSNKISAQGVGLGYSAAILVQILSILLLMLASKFLSSSSLPLRLILLLAGLSWFALTVPAAVWLRKRPGPPLPSHLTKLKLIGTYSTLNTTWTYFLHSWRSLLTTIKTAFSLPQLRLFLVAWFLLSDATATVGSTAILFARTELGLSPTGVALLSITANGSGIIGSLLWPYLARRFAWRTNHAIFLCICQVEFIPIYGLLGYLPPVQALGFLGLQQAWEIFPLACIYGIAMGGLSAYCRSFYGQMIPAGYEAAFFSLFAITDKGSSAIGPAIVGRITDVTGSIRPAFWFLLVLVGLPAIILRWVDGERGAEEARMFKKVRGSWERDEVELDVRRGSQGEEREAFLAGS